MIVKIAVAVVVLASLPTEAEAQYTCEQVRHAARTMAHGDLKRIARNLTRPQRRAALACLNRPTGEVKDGVPAKKDDEVY